MQYLDALQAVGGLGKPSKMPWWSWSISATECITGSKLAEVEGTVCSGCYALKGNYRFANVVEAQERRLAAARDPGFVDAFVIVLKHLLKHQRRERRPGVPENRFRWFDAGDLQDVEMLDKIVQIARATPEISHWLPTRELPVVRAYLAGGGSFPPNLVVRTSSPKIGVAPKQRPFDLPVSTVSAPGARHDCPASQQGNKCLSCDACWSTRDINYHYH